MPPPPFLVASSAEASVYVCVRCSCGQACSEKSRVTAFLSVCVSFGWMPGKLSGVPGNSSTFQAGDEQCDVISVFTCCNSSGSCFSNLPASRRTLVLFSSDILLCNGSLSSLLNIAACTTTLVFRLLSRFSRPVTVSMDWTNLDLRAPVMILDAWLCTLLT